MHRFFCFTFILLLSACSDLGYYWDMTRGHLSLMNKRVDIDDMLEQPDIGADLKQRLLLVKQIRAFSVDQLALPESASYSSYVQLDRPYVLQNLFAASEFSTQLHRWCYPIVGCASYRGYYHEERLNEYVEQLKAQGFDTHIGYVPAYSTLGWFDDPVLSSFIDWPDYRLAGLLFHELAHQRLYIDDDTQFNESLAVAVHVVFRVDVDQDILNISISIDQVSSDRFSDIMSFAHRGFLFHQDVGIHEDLPADPARPQIMACKNPGRAGYVILDFPDDLFTERGVHQVVHTLDENFVTGPADQ